MNPQVDIMTLSSYLHSSGFYEVREEAWFYNGVKTTANAAYTLKGDLIGSPHLAYELTIKRGITPEKKNPRDKHCSIGFCPKEQKWYGWSRAFIQGFSIGMVLFDDDWMGDPPNSEDKERFVHTKKIRTLEDAKKAAIKYVENLE